MDNIIIEALNSVGIEGYIPNPQFVEQVRENKLDNSTVQLLHKHAHNVIPSLKETEHAQYIVQTYPYYNPDDDTADITAFVTTSEYYFYKYYVTAKRAYTYKQLFPLNVETIVLLNARLRGLKHNSVRDVDVYLSGTDVKLCPGDKRLITSLLLNWTGTLSSLPDVNLETLLRYHVLFELIHPFTDGNGRVGRLLLNLELRRRTKANLVWWDYTKRSAYYAGLRIAEQQLQQLFTSFSWYAAVDNWTTVTDITDTLDVTKLAEAIGE